MNIKSINFHYFEVWTFLKDVNKYEYVMEKIDNWIFKNLIHFHVHVLVFGYNIVFWFSTSN